MEQQDPDGDPGVNAPVRVRGREILGATIDLVREQGLSNLRVADVAARAGTSSTSVIYYFASKDLLFEQAVADADARFYAALEPELRCLDSGLDRLALLIVRSSDSDWRLWMDTRLFARRSPEMQRAERGFETRWCQTIAEAIRHGVERGEFEASDPDGVAVRLAALSEGLAEHMVLEHPGRTRDHYLLMLIRAACNELGCDESALWQATERVPTTAAAPAVSPPN
jgi:AcrR family transcriptional regulator